mgnify:CR=1 FL=1
MKRQSLCLSHTSHHSRSGRLQESAGRGLSTCQLRCAAAGTAAYCAPEVLNPDSPHSLEAAENPEIMLAADVWSFGVSTLPRCHRQQRPMPDTCWQSPLPTCSSPASGHSSCYAVRCVQVSLWELLERRRPYSGMDGFQVQTQVGHLLPLGLLGGWECALQAAHV